MKPLDALTTAFLAMLLTARAGIIAQWNFNSPVPDGDTSTGTNAPSSSAGPASASLVGGVTGGFSAGCNSDPAASDNSGWQTAHYPGTASNKTAGVQFNVDTSGYENISLSWFERHSGTASRYLRLQYTFDGGSFTDADVLAVYADSVFTNKTVNLSGIPGAANNPSFGFRIVSEFESTATGSGASAYLATKDGSTYGGSGTIRFDMVTVSGSFIPGANTPPGISGIKDQTLRVGRATFPLDFFVWDTEDPGTSLTVNAVSSNPMVIPESGIVFGGSGVNRTVTITAGNQPGTAALTLYVIDPGGKSNSTTFSVTVLPLNTAPVISRPSWTNTIANTPTRPIAFNISDLETSAQNLRLSGSSGNPALVPDSNIVFGGSGSNRTVTLTPASGQTGVAPITLTVSDGASTSSCVFPLMVTPSATVIFYDPFSYPDGSLLTNSVFLWANRSGTFGQCQVTNGELQISAAQSEDISAPLAGGPYPTNHGTVLYAAFKAKFLNLPKIVPSCFAHFVGGSHLLGRIYAGTTNAAPGNFRLSAANASDSAAELPIDLQTNTTYTFVTRYDVDAASTTLWLNPLAESDAGVSATDPQTPVSISSYGFRQDSTLGATTLVDELTVGLSFAAVLPSTTLNLPPVTIRLSGSSVVLTWTDSGFALQSAPAAAGPFINIPAATSPFTNQAIGAARFFRLKAR
ncbi:MAG TPA: Ig-like domain-containing protein [Candidatus Binatia bacterium]|jgi:hypothetical protein|nr:Ig-like domain-containing protein [Candidatus Binatia bacterium]